MKTISKLAISIIAIILSVTMSSCGSARPNGYPPMAGRGFDPGGGYQTARRCAPPVRRYAEAQASACDDDVVEGATTTQSGQIIENGQAGRMMVHRVNGKVVETRWVRGDTDPNTFEGRPVHHHEHTRVHEKDLDRTVSTLLEKMKSGS